MKNTIKNKIELQEALNKIMLQTYKLIEAEFKSPKDLEMQGRIIHGLMEQSYKKRRKLVKAYYDTYPLEKRAIDV